MVSMQRPCAHAETDARLVAGPGRTLTSVRPLLLTRRTGRAEARPWRNLLHQPSAASRNQTRFLNMRKQRQRSDGRYKMILCSLRFLLFNKILLKWQDFTVLQSKGTHPSTSQSKSVQVNISEYNQYNIVCRILFPPRRIPANLFLANFFFQATPTPALSRWRGRGRIVGCHLENPAAGLAGRASAKPESSDICSFSQGEKVRMRASLSQKQICAPRPVSNRFCLFNRPCANWRGECSTRRGIWRRCGGR